MRVLSRWRPGPGGAAGGMVAEGGFMVATSALGTGMDFTQESGRGGRAGETLDSVVLVEHGEVERTME